MVATPNGGRERKERMRIVGEQVGDHSMVTWEQDLGDGVKLGVTTSYDMTTMLLCYPTERVGMDIALLAVENSGMVDLSTWWLIDSEVQPDGLTYDLYEPAD